MPEHRSAESGRVSAVSAVRSAIEDTSLGPMLLVEGDYGICHLQFANSRDELERIRSSVFTDCDRSITTDFARLLQAVIRVVDGEGTGASLALELRGTFFQKLVWQNLLQIPSGTTISYQELAQRIGRPRATRAVASACGANRIAVLIPCHRVLRSDGGLGGYRWGIERKRQLLQRETSWTRPSTAKPLILTNRATAASVSVAQAERLRA
jgi:AraC family transcriptional regulator of adaptative response/methylated-DNA-[protein]-cysteine methyltransferase